MATQPKLYNIAGTLVGDVEVKANTNKKPYALAKVAVKGDKTVTVMTYVQKGIDALKGKKAGDEVKLYGTYTKGDKGQTFSAMGVTQPKKAVAGPEVA